MTTDDYQRFLKNWQTLARTLMCDGPFTTKKQLRRHETITQVYGSDPVILRRRGDMWLAATNERMICKKVKVMECPNSVNSMLHGFYFGCSVLEKVIEETRYRLHYVHGLL